MKPHQSPKDFLSACTTSASAYQQFKQLLDLLSHEQSQAIAANMLFELERSYRQTEDKKQFSDQYFFSFHEISIARGQKLRLLQFPSIFSPEEWSFTFYEGLSRFSDNEFTDKVMAELGCGNGWISIALAKRCPIKKVYGLDINPRAITCAQINTYLNGLDPDGKPIYDHASRTLWDKVEFVCSDLLQALQSRNVVLDLVVGCIPQVLSPDPEALLEIATEAATDQELYDLSNYTEAHGYIEDQFGLGLIAKATEEAVQSLQPNGRLIFNLGGRPGRKVLEGLFTRRGFVLNRIWSTRVIQAGDTEIDALVAIERSSQHRFEFYMGHTAQESISAQTAQALAHAGGQIAHSLSVYEAKLPAHDQVATILKFLSKPEYKKLHEGLDLSSDDQEVYRERVSFLASLAKQLENKSELPYGSTQGSENLRRNIALYLHSYFRSPIREENVLITTSRSDFIVNIIDTYRPKVVLCDQYLLQEIQLIPGSLQNRFPQILESPRRVDLLKELISRLKPELVITSLNEFENESPEVLAQLFEATAKTKSRLIIDISEFFEISSQPSPSAALMLLAEKALPIHVTLMCGLVKNKVYSDLHLCFAIAENKSFLNSMIAAAELSYSRAPLLTQEYYSKIFEDLLTFHLAEARGFGSHSRPLQDEDSQTGLTGISDSSKKAFTHPSISRMHLPIQSDTIRLDYGENILPVSSTLQTSIYEAFVRKDLTYSDYCPKPEITKIIASTFGLKESLNHRITSGSGVAPLFASILQYIALQGQSIVFPYGSYGEFYAAALFYGVPIINCVTQESNHFKYAPKALHESLVGTKDAWIFLNAPCSNPTGALYSNDELAEIITVVKSHGANIIFDATFSGLEFNPNSAQTQLGDMLDHKLDWVLLLGVSKLFAGGGLRYGAAITNSAPLEDAFLRSSYRPPHLTVQYAVKQLYRALLDQEPSLIASLGEQRLLLSRRVKQLSNCLSESGWDVLAPQGGLFLIAKPSFFLGKTTSISEADNRKIAINSANIASILLEKKNLLINGSDWTGIDGYCRFVLSVTEDDFNQALDILREFYRDFQ